VVAKRVTGIAAKNPLGYRPVWEVGRAANIKKRQRITSINRPST